MLIPSCTEFVSGYHRVRTAALARALENTCVTVLSPTVGDAPWSPAIDRNAGAAGIFVPADRSLSDTGVLAAGALNQPQWVYADVDLERLRPVKASGEMRNATDWPLQPAPRRWRKVWRWWRCRRRGLARVVESITPARCRSICPLLSAQRKYSVQSEPYRN